MSTPLSEHEEYERELLQFMSILHDLLIAGAKLSSRTIDYILRHAEKLGERIGNFPTSHPIFAYIAQSESITLGDVPQVIKLSHRDPKVFQALAQNTALSEPERVTFALQS